MSAHTPRCNMPEHWQSDGQAHDPRLIAAAPRMRSGITGLLADLDANRDRAALAALVMKWAPALRAILRDVDGAK